VPGDTDPLAALEVVELELALPTWRLSNSSSPRSAACRPLDPAIAAGLKAAPAAIEYSSRERLVPFESACRRSRALKPFFLLTDKPRWLINVARMSLPTPTR